jgi:inosose dehydratase
MKLAGAPISWGVCEAPGWGHQLTPKRVLAEAQALGMSAVEAGPQGFLPSDAKRARRVAASHGLTIIGGFVTAILHARDRQAEQLAEVERQARWLADAGADILVLAAASASDGYETATTLDEAEWRMLLDSLVKLREMAVLRGLRLAVHPHVGTVIESAQTIERLLRETSVPLCLDTGHIFVGGADPAEIVEKEPGRVIHVHLKDADDELATLVRERKIPYHDAVRRGLFRPLGEGDVGIADVIAALRASSYDGWAVLEQDVMLRSEADDPLPAIEKSLAFAKAHA